MTKKHQPSQLPAIPPYQKSGIPWAVFLPRTFLDQLNPVVITWTLRIKTILIDFLETLVKANAGPALQDPWNIITKISIKSTSNCYILNQSQILRGLYHMMIRLLQINNLGDFFGLTPVWTTDRSCGQGLSNYGCK